MDTCSTAFWRETRMRWTMEALHCACLAAERQTPNALPDSRVSLEAKALSSCACIAWLYWDRACHMHRDRWHNRRNLK